MCKCLMQAHRQIPGDVLKIFPVLVSAQYDHTPNVPTAFAGGVVYCLNDTHLTTPFSHTHVANDYHALVFSMCRLPHPPTNKPIGEVIRLPPANSRTGKVLAGYFPRRGREREREELHKECI